MNCFRCEVIRAKIACASLAIVGKSGQEMIDHLNNRFGKYYFHNPFVNAVCRVTNGKPITIWKL